MATIIECLASLILKCFEGHSRSSFSAVSSLLNLSLGAPTVTLKGEFSIMFRHILPFLAVAVFTIMTVPVWGGSNAKDSLSATINVESTSSLSNTKLAPGEYKVVTEGNMAKFERNGNVVAEVPFTWKTLSTKSPYTAVLSDHDRITEIDFSGKTAAIEFPSRGSSGN